MDHPDRDRQYLSISYYARRYKKNKTIVLRCQKLSDGNYKVDAGKHTNKTLIYAGMSTNG